VTKRKSCPICKNTPPAQAESAPFCSERCQKVDLFRWFEGKYTIVDQLDPIEAQILASEGDVSLADGSEQ